MCRFSFSLCSPSINRYQTLKSKHQLHWESSVNHFWFGWFFFRKEIEYYQVQSNRESFFEFSSDWFSYAPVFYTNIQQLFFANVLMMIKWFYFSSFCLNSWSSLFHRSSNCSLELDFYVLIVVIFIHSKVFVCFSAFMFRFHFSK